MWQVPFSGPPPLFRCLHIPFGFKCMFIMMFLQGNVVSPEKVHPRLWVGSNRKFRAKPYGPTNTDKHNKVRMCVGILGKKSKQNCTAKATF